MTVSFMWFARIWAGAYGVQIHFPIEPANAFRVHLMSVFTQMLNHTGNPIKRGLRILFIY